MSAPSRSDVPPTSIGIDLREEGVVVEYLDGRTTLYLSPRRESRRLRRE
jgi:hypothetical protein